MYKKSASNLTIIYKSLSTFFYKLPQFLMYILYPVFGQLIGIYLAFAPFLMASSPESVYLPAVLITAPLGIGIFCHSFWRFLIVSGGLVLISKQIIENETVREFKYYTEVFQKRASDYIAYLLILCFIWIIIGITITGIAFVYTIANNLSTSGLTIPIAFVTIAFLILMPLFSTIPIQSFVLSPNLTPFESIVKSIKLTARNYFSAFGFWILIVVITGLYGVLIDYFLKTLIFTQTFYMQYNHTEAYKAMATLLNACASGALANILLPFITLCFTWWYLRVEKSRNAKIAGYR